jgi:hypothetical protein
MQIRKLTTATALVGACALGSLTAVSSANAATSPGGRPAIVRVPDVSTPHWVRNGSSYFTWTACAAEGQYIVENFPHYDNWDCRWNGPEDLWDLWLLYDPL